jgi:hypothetical protein
MGPTRPERQSARGPTSSQSAGPERQRACSALPQWPSGAARGEAALIPEEALLDDRQLSYSTRVIGLPRDQPTKPVLPVTLREGDRHAQGPPEDRAWAEVLVRGFQSLGQLGNWLGPYRSTRPGV